MQVAQPPGLYVADLVDSRQHAFDEFVDLLPGAGDEVAIAPAVVVVEARRCAD